jgi:hypothetical protein
MGRALPQCLAAVLGGLDLSKITSALEGDIWADFRSNNRLEERTVEARLALCVDERLADAVRKMLGLDAVFRITESRVVYRPQPIVLADGTASLHHWGYATGTIQIVLPAWRAEYHKRLDALRETVLAQVEEKLKENTVSSPVSSIIRPPRSATGLFVYLPWLVGTIASSLAAFVFAKPSAPPATDAAANKEEPSDRQIIFTAEEAALEKEMDKLAEDIRKRLHSFPLEGNRKLQLEGKQYSFKRSFTRSIYRLGRMIFIVLPLDNYMDPAKSICQKAKELAQQYKDRLGELYSEHPNNIFFIPPWSAQLREPLNDFTASGLVGMLAKENYFRDATIID